MDGSVGPAAQSARDWALALSEATGLPVALWDERLSRAAVNRFLVEQADLSRASRAVSVDRMAAAWTLQAALGRIDGAGKAAPEAPTTPAGGGSGSRLTSWSGLHPIWLGLA